MHPDPRTLHALCCSSQVDDLHQGFHQLGEILWVVARARLNSAQFDQAVVQDCVQQALGMIWQQLQNNRGPRQPESFVHWAISVVTFKCIDHVRHSERHATAGLDNLPDATTLQPLPGSESTALLPEELIILDDEKRRLLLSIRNHPTLSDDSKQILIEGFLLEKSDDELAALLGQRKGTIHVIRSRNLKKLRTDVGWMAKLTG